MRFNLKRPCAECPFSKHSNPFLSAERAREIANYVTSEDRTFTCHKHLNGEHLEDDNGRNRYEAALSDQHCAGAIAMVRKTQSANAMLQIAERLGILDPTRLDADCLDDVFDSPEAMAAHHRS